MTDLPTAKHVWYSCGPPDHNPAFFVSDQAIKCPLGNGMNQIHTTG